MNRSITRRTAGAPVRGGLVVIALRVLLGTAVPVAVAWTLSVVDDPVSYRPGVILLGVVVALSVFGGLEAACAALASSTLSMWWWFTPLTGSFAFQGPDDAGGLAVYCGACAGVLYLVARVTRARAVADAERAIADALLDAVPIGVAMFDHDRRMIRVNSHHAEVSGSETAALLGRHPEDTASPARELHGADVAAVLASGMPVERSVTLQQEGWPLPRHWTARHVPVRAAGGALLGVGSVVADVTTEETVRRRSEQLLDLARQLAATLTRDDFVVAVTDFLAEAFGARSLVAVVDEEGSSLVVHRRTVGYRPEAADLWARTDLGIEREVPLTTAARLGELVVVEDLGEYDTMDEEMAHERRIVGDLACVCVPVKDPSTGRVTAVLRVGWPYRRAATDASRTLCETVASLSALALRRIDLVDRASRDQFRGALDSMLNDVTIGSAIRGADGAIVDFRIDYMNRSSVDGAGRTSADLVGARVLDMYPGWAESGRFDEFTAVVETGVPLVHERMRYRDTLEDGSVIDGYWNLQVTRFGDGYIAASRDVTETVRLELAEREALEMAGRERRALEVLQQSALPSSLPADQRLAFGTQYHPAASGLLVGGDCFDAFVVAPDVVAILIADVAGHGLAAAGFMVQIRNVIRGAAAAGADPVGVLERANRVAAELAGDDGPFVTACYATVDLRTGRLEFTLAGHPPPVLARSGTAHLLQQRPCLPLAVDGAATYRSETVSLEPGDRLVLFTDGLVERRGEVLDDGLDRLTAWCVDTADLAAGDAAARMVELAGPSDDDTAVLIVDYTGEP